MQQARMWEQGTESSILTSAIDGVKCPYSRSRRLHSRKKRVTWCVEPEAG